MNKSIFRDNYFLAVILCITFLIPLIFVIPSDGALDYGPDGLVISYDVYDMTNFVFDGETGEFEDTTIEPYTKLRVEGTGTDVIVGGIYRNLDYLSFGYPSGDELIDQTVSDVDIENVVEVVNIKSIRVSSMNTVKIYNVNELTISNGEYADGNYFSIKLEDNARLEISHSTVYIPFPIWCYGISETIKIDNSTIVIKDTDTGGFNSNFNNGIFNYYNTNMMIARENTPSELILDNTTIVIPNANKEIEIVSPLVINYFDKVKISNIKIHYSSSSPNVYFGSSVFISKVADFTIQNCLIQNYFDIGIKFDYIIGTGIIKNNIITNPMPYGSETVVGIAGDYDDVLTFCRETQPAGHVYIINNNITRVQIGIMTTLVKSTILNNTIYNFVKNPNSPYGKIGILVHFTTTDVVSYVPYIVHKINYNKIISADIGITSIMSSEIHYNIIENCHNAIAGLPSIYGNYDYHVIHAEYNYLGKDYPIINKIDNINPVVASNGGYDGDIVYGTNKYKFFYEPFALKKPKYNPERTYTIGFNLKTGWNLIYMPYILPHDYTVNNIFLISPSIEIVVLKNNEGKYIAFTKDGLNDYNIDDHPYAFYIFSKSDIQIELPIGNIATQYTFIRGWNLYGYIVSGKLFEQWLEDQEEITAIVYRDSNSGNYQSVIISHPLTDQQKTIIRKLEPTQGVFIFFAGEKTYYVDAPIYDEESGIIIPPQQG